MRTDRYYRKTVVIILGFILFPLLGCSTAQPQLQAEPVALPKLVTYTDGINGFSISYPQQWSRMPDSTTGGALVSFGDGPGPATGPSVTVSSVPVDKYSYNNNFHTAVTPCNTFTIISQQESVQNYMPAQKYVYTAQCGTTSLKALQLYLIHKNTQWTVTCAGTPESFDDMFDIFDAVVSSFSLRAEKALAARPKIDTFTTSADTVERGQPALLTWKVTGADTVALHPSLDSAGTTGTLQVSPSSSTTYTLVATNQSGISTGSITVAVANGGTTIDYDPVTGRNADIGFEWEQYCLATGYQMQIANDPGFTRLVYDSGVFTPDSTTSPAMLYRAGGVLQAGHTYYWRVRITETATGQVLQQSPWSKTQTFSISPGAPVTTPYYGIQVIMPENNCGGVPVNGTAFAWSPYQNTDMYKFVLSRDAALRDIVAVVEVDTPAFLYDGALDYDTGYFWKVTARTPAQSESSATFSFTTGPAPQTTAGPTDITPPAESLPSAPVATSPPWAWVIIAIGCILIVITAALLFKIRRK
jgi:hypothetical protein